MPLVVEDLVDLILVTAVDTHALRLPCKVRRDRLDMSVLDLTTGRWPIFLSWALTQSVHSR